MSIRRKTLAPVVAILAVCLCSLACADEGHSGWKLSGDPEFGKLHTGYSLTVGLKNESSHTLELFIRPVDRSTEPESGAMRGLGIGYDFSPKSAGKTGFSLALGYQLGLTDGHADHLRIQFGVQF